MKKENNILLILGIITILLFSLINFISAVNLPNLARPIPISSCGVIARPGVYILTNNLSAYTNSSVCILIKSSDVILDGAGYTISSNDSAKLGISVQDYDVWYSQLKNIQIKNVYIANFSQGISSFYISSCVFENITVKTTDSPARVLGDASGIYVFNGLNNTILNNKIEGGSYGIKISGGKENYLASNQINLAFKGISLGYSDNNQINNNTLNTDSYSIESYSSSGNRWTNNTLGYHSRGISICEGNNNKIENNQLNKKSEGPIFKKNLNNSIIIINLFTWKDNGLGIPFKSINLQ